MLREFSIDEIRKVHMDSGHYESTIMRTTIDDVLNEIGYSTQDIIQSDFVLFVEGPDDKKVFELVLQKYYDIDLNRIKIVDTYGVFRLDSIASELAFKTGVPVKKMSDVIMARLMNPESDFINDLRTTKGQNNLSAHSGSYSWGHRGDGSYVSMDFTVRNNSSQTVSGKDYYLVITPRRYSTGKVYQSKTVDGIDIAPQVLLI